MQYRSIGSTGVLVSALGFGGATLGNVYGALDEAAAIRAARKALDAGITLFDVSPYYGDTLAETVLGRALAGRRAEAVIATKAGRNGRDDFDFSASAIRRSLEGSLRRLGTDYVDLLFAHDIAFGRPSQILEETYEELEALKREGKCRAIGMSALPLAVLSRAVTARDLDVVLSYCHGALTDDSLLRDLLPIAQARGTAVINASPLCVALLSDASPPGMASRPPGAQGRVSRGRRGMRDSGPTTLAGQFELGLSTCRRRVHPGRDQDLRGSGGQSSCVSFASRSDRSRRGTEGSGRRARDGLAERG